MFEFKFYVQSSKEMRMTCTGSLCQLCSWTAASLDEMSTRIDDLEKNIADLMTQAGVEEIEAMPEKAKESQGS